MERSPLQLRHRLPVLKQPPKAEGFVLLRPNGVQPHPGKPGGHVSYHALIYRRGAEKGVQFPAQLFCLLRKPVCQRRAGDNLRLLDQAVQDTQHLPLHPGWRAAAAQLPQFLLGRRLFVRTCPPLALYLHRLEFRLRDDRREAGPAGVPAVRQDTGRHILVPGLVPVVGDAPLPELDHQGAVAVSGQIAVVDPAHRLSLCRMKYDLPKLHFVTVGPLPAASHHLTVRSIGSASSSPLASRNRRRSLLSAMILSTSSRNSSPSKASRNSGPASRASISSWVRRIV